MLPSTRARWLAVLLFICAALLAACDAGGAQDAVSTATASPSITPTQSPTLTATKTSTPSRTPTPTQEPSPTQTPIPSPTPTKEPEQAYSLPEGWQELGNLRLGQQIAAPLGWVDLSDLARSGDWTGRHGPQILLAVDSQPSGQDILAGRPLNGGAFIFGFHSEAMTPSTDPASGLLSLLGELSQEETLAYRRVVLEASGLPAAYVELDTSPLAEFQNEGQQLSFRLLSIADLENERQAFFLMGTDTDDWDAYQDTFDEMMHSINLSPEPASVGRQLENGDQAKGELSARGSQLWPFNSSGGQYATISLTPEDGVIDLTLILIDPDGNILASTDNGFAGDHEVLTDILLPDDGTYLIEVGEFFKMEGQYQVSLTLADQPQFGGGGRIDFGREINSELSEDGEDIWVFGGTAGQEVSLVLTALDEQLDVILEVRGPDGQELLSIDEGFAGDAEVVTGLALPVTGDYQIIVYGFAGRGGAYKLALDEGGESTVNFYDAGDLEYGENARDFLRQDEAHAWFFEGAAGDFVTIEVSPLGASLDLDIWLLDPELNDVAMKDEYLAGESEKIEEQLPSDGQYLVLIREFFGEPGEYEIRLNAGGDDLLEIAGQIEYSEVVSGTLPAGRHIGWWFQGSTDEIVNVVLTPLDTDRDLVLALVDPQGETAVSIDTSLSGLPEQLSSFRLTDDGRWMILIREFFNEGAEYELTLNRQR